MNIDNFDLNLVRVFLAIAKHRNVTTAGLHLGLTQSSVSHSLARLRALCNDQLFVRTSEGMLPTAASSAMIEPLENALATMRNSLKGTIAFDPRAADRTFRLLLSDIGQLTYLPALSDYLARRAPGVRVTVLQLPIDAYRDALARGDADLAVGHLPSLQSGFHQLRLFEDPYVCMLRADHPFLATPVASAGGRRKASPVNSITLDQYLESSHIVVEPPGRGPGLVEQALARSKKKRRIVLQLPHFFAGPLILRRTDCLMTAPQRVRTAISDLNNICFVPLPFVVEKMNVKVLWHERMHHDAGHRWLRNALSELFSEKGGGTRRQAEASRCLTSIGR